MGKGIIDDIGGWNENNIDFIAKAFDPPWAVATDFRMAMGLLKGKKGGEKSIYIFPSLQGKEFYDFQFHV
jgi:hypothetical protein